MSTADEDRAELERILCGTNVLHRAECYMLMVERLIAEKAASERRPLPAGEIQSEVGPVKHGPWVYGRVSHEPPDPRDEWTPGKDATAERRPMGGEVMEVCFRALHEARIALLDHADLRVVAPMVEKIEAAQAALRSHTSAKAEPVKAEAQAVAKVIRLPNRNGIPGLEWLEGAEVRVGMMLYPHPASIDDIRRAAEAAGCMLCRWEPAPYVGEDECSFVSNPDGELTVPLFQPTEGKYKWLSGLTAPKEGG